MTYQIKVQLWSTWKYCLETERSGSYPLTKQDQFKFYMESFGNVEEKWYHGRHRVISCWSWWQLLWVGGTCNRAHCFRQIPRKRRQWWCSSRLQMQGRFFRTELRHHGTISGNFRIILNSGVTPPSANPLDNSSSHFFFKTSLALLYFSRKKGKGTNTAKIIARTTTTESTQNKSRQVLKTFTTTTCQSINDTVSLRYWMTPEMGRDSHQHIHVAKLIVESS